MSNELIISRAYTAKNLMARKLPVAGIVLHDTAGSGTIGDVKYLANDPERRGVSSDFVITREGEIFQLSKDLKKQCTGHAGRRTKFRQFINGNVNHATIGIELSQKVNLSLKPVWPEAQIKAVAKLCAKLCKDFKLTVDDITTHARIITDGSRSDPRQFPWSQFYGFFNGDDDDPRLTAPIEPVTVTAKKFNHTVQKGDTLWGLAQKYKTTVESIKALNNLETSTINVGQELRVI